MTRDAYIIRHSRIQQVLFLVFLYYAYGVVSCGFEVNLSSLKTHMQQVRDKSLY